MTTGPLGQGFANGVGMAIAERFLADNVQPAARPDRRPPRLRDLLGRRPDGRRLLRSRARSPARTALGKLLYFYDDNHITIDGTTSISFTEDRAKRFEALGWHVQHVHDANDLDAFREAIANARDVTDKPSVVVVRSHIAYGAPKAVDTAKAHGSPLGEEEVAATKKALGWDPDKHFYVPDEVYEHMSQVGARQRARDRLAAPLRVVVGEVPARPRDVGRRLGRQDRLLDSRPTSSPASRSRRATPARRSCRRSSTPSRR